MAKKKAAKARPKKKAKPKGGAEADIHCKVKVRAVNVGDGTAAIGFQLARSNVNSEDSITLAKADEILVNARLDVALRFEQRELFEGKEELLAVGDCAKISVGKETIGGRLSFSRDDVDLEHLATFAGKAAVLTLTRTGERPAKAGASDDEDAEDADQAAQPDAEAKS